jgi:hypothetical protein
MQNKQAIVHCISVIIIVLNAHAATEHKCGSFWRELEHVLQPRENFVKYVFILKIMNDNLLEISNDNWMECQTLPRQENIISKSTMFAQSKIRK